MFVYTAAELHALRPRRPTVARHVRKMLFRYRIWCPHRHRGQVVRRIRCLRRLVPDRPYTVAPVLRYHRYEDTHRKRSLVNVSIMPDPPDSSTQMKFGVLNVRSAGNKSAQLCDLINTSSSNTRQLTEMCWIIILLIMLDCSLAYGNDVEHSHQLASISGDTVRMECNENISGTVDWKVDYDPRLTATYICLRGRLLDKYKLRFDLDPNKYTLTIHNVMVNDSGLYYCVDGDGFGEQHYTRLDVVLPPPGQLYLVNRTETSLTIRFNQTGRVTGYNVSVNGRLTSDAMYSGIGHEVITATVHNLIPGSRYSVSVWSSRDGIDSKTSTTANCSTVPAAPGPLSLVNRTETCMTISWNQIGRVTNYTVMINDRYAQDAEFSGVGTELINVAVCSLSIETNYQVSITAVSDEDMSEATSGKFKMDDISMATSHVTPIAVGVPLAVTVVAMLVVFIIFNCYRRKKNGIAKRAQLADASLGQLLRANSLNMEPPSEPDSTDGHATNPLPASFNVAFSGKLAQLTKSICVDDRLLNRLQDCGLFTRFDRQPVQSCLTAAEKCSELLSLLERCDGSKMEQFFQALVATNQRDIVNFILDRETDENEFLPAPPKLRPRLTREILSPVLRESETCTVRITSYNEFQNLTAITPDGFSVTYCASHSQWGKVAYKQLNGIRVIDEQLARDLKREAQVLEVNHPNIVKLLGIVLEPDHYGLVFEFAEFYGLDDFLKKYDVRFRLKMSFAMDIIEGMAYLHSFEPPVIHGNLRLQNILVSDGYTAKICGFGLAKWKRFTTQHTSSTSSPCAGTVTHFPPEIWNELLSPRTEKFDIYSFGILLWELLSEQVPYQEAHGNIEKLRSAVTSGKRPPLKELKCPENLSEFVRGVIECCWNQKPEVRMAFRDLRHKVQQFVDKKALTVKKCKPIELRK